MLQSVIIQEAPIPLSSGVKYMRRSDLTSTIRLQIASIALLFSRRGTISDLSLRYGVSRTFIYSLSNHLRDNLIPLFGTNIGKLQEKVAYYESIKRILELRLIGRSSLSAISDLLKRQGLKYTSIGFISFISFISETLHKIGESIGNLIVWEGSCVWASDEIFFKGHQPILVTVDVASSAILSITKLTSLTKEGWLEAEKEVLRLTELLEGFNFLYRCILVQFTLFDTRDATLRERVFAEQEVQTALDYMKGLNINGLPEVIKEVQKLLPHLFAFLDTVKNGLQELEKTIEPTPLPFWKRAWQYAKIAYKIKGNYALKQKFFLKMNDDLAL